MQKNYFKFIYFDTKNIFINFIIIIMKKKLILSFFYLICFFFALDVKSLDIDNMSCQSKNKISDNLQKQHKLISNYNYTINLYSLTQIQSILLRIWSW